MQKDRVRRRLVSIVAMGALLAFCGSALAHHSFVMYNGDNPIELEGTVKEFRFVSPHSFIILSVKTESGDAIWNLEGASASALVREGWSHTTLKPGDELVLKVEPLRSGAPGGCWYAKTGKFKNGTPLPVVHK